MDAAAIMSATVTLVGPTATLKVAAGVLRETGAPMLVVMDGERPAGALYARDLGLEACARGLDPTAAGVQEVMRPRLPACRPDTAPEQALEQMLGAGVDALAVIDDSGRVVGVLGLLRLLSALALHAAGEPAGPELEHTRRVRGEPT
jgi:CBS domain-containing protein